MRKYSEVQPERVAAPTARAATSGPNIHHSNPSDVLMPL